MGKRGPAAKPTNIRYLHGDDKVHPERVNRSEPQPANAEAKPPTWLSKQARKVWKRLAPDLKAKGVLTPWDVEAFASYCDAVVRRAEAAKMLEEQGQVVELPVFNKNGELTGYRTARNPWLLTLNDADAQVQRWGARFGMTPSDRAGIKLPPPGGDGDDYLT